MMWFCVAVIYASFYGLIGFLCWLFHSGWPLLLIILAPNVSQNRKKSQ